MSKKIDLVGLTFNRLTVAALSHKNKHGQLCWKCKCNCGNPNYIVVVGYHLKNGAIKSCGCLSKESAHKRCYKGTKNISLSYFHSIKSDAIKRNLEFDITIEYAQYILEQQNYKCALSGTDICGSQNTRKQCSTYKEQTASLDRIDSTKGYIEGNIQWIHKEIQFIKLNKEEKRLFYWCYNIADYKRNEKQENTIEYYI